MAVKKRKANSITDLATDVVESISADEVVVESKSKVGLEKEKGGSAISDSQSKRGCKKVEKMTKEVGGVSRSQWFCHGCGSVFTDKKEERKHTYRTNLWLRKHAKALSEVEEPGQGGPVETGVQDGELLDNSEKETGGGESSTPSRKKRKPLRGRRGGVSHIRKIVCKDFHSTGCKKGARCRYLHTTPNQESDSRGPLPSIGVNNKSARIEGPSHRGKLVKAGQNRKSRQAASHGGDDGEDGIARGSKHGGSDMHVDSTTVDSAAVSAKRRKLKGDKGAKTKSRKLPIDEKPLDFGSLLDSI